MLRLKNVFSGRIHFRLEFVDLARRWRSDRANGLTLLHDVDEHFGLNLKSIFIIILIFIKEKIEPWKDFFYF